MSRTAWGFVGGRRTAADGLPACRDLGAAAPPVRTGTDLGPSTVLPGEGPAGTARRSASDVPAGSDPSASGSYVLKRKLSTSPSRTA